YWRTMGDPVFPHTTKHDTIQKTCVYYPDPNGPPFTENYQVHTNYIMTDTAGTKHNFEVRHVVPGPDCGDPDPTNTDTGVALDGTGTIIDISSNRNTPTYTMADNDGPKNGNNPVDSLGRTLVTVTTGNGYQLLTIHDSNGTSQQFRIDLTSVTI